MNGRTGSTAICREHLCMASTMPATQDTGTPVGYAVAIAMGANVGDRVANLCEALRLLPQHGIKVLEVSRLYESAPAYVTEQPAFLNAALLALTPLEPLKLLAALKVIERALGRTEGGQRFGPRQLDLDIVFYEGMRYTNDGGLEIPHPRWRERPFVMAPLADLAGGDAGPAHQVRSIPWEDARRAWAAAGGEASLGSADLRCVLPLTNGRTWPWQGRTHVMGILNVTPDSFSDGGELSSVADAVKRAQDMAAAGADIIDVGGQSTRPGAEHVGAQEEAARIVPVIRTLAADERMREVLISVDTFHSAIAQEAVAAGAHIVNDVSGGSLDPSMHSVVAELGTPYVLMHMRGDPATMQAPEHTAYADVCAEVGAELQTAAERAIAAGIEPWRIVLDPGIGFAKTGAGSCALMGGLPRVRAQLRGALRGMPLLVGHSRKSFLGRLTGRENPADRDVASAAAAALSSTALADQ
ncbi:hypothetical protein WJX81_000282 [Elliptochloris bilobata]|uniref:Pterin-binding domain-containing protein n=1 Tax=Elliptochloris bilobata TaxID=381761 RepID=A0AAW1SBS1_9CHLO